MVIHTKFKKICKVVIYGLYLSLIPFLVSCQKSKNTVYIYEKNKTTILFTNHYSVTLEADDQFSDTETYNVTEKIFQELEENQTYCVELQPESYAMYSSIPARIKQIYYYGECFKDSD